MNTNDICCVLLIAGIFSHPHYTEVTAVSEIFQSVSYIRQLLILCSQTMEFDDNFDTQILNMYYYTYNTQILMISNMKHKWQVHRRRQLRESLHRRLYQPPGSCQPH